VTGQACAEFVAIGVGTPSRSAMTKVANGLA
jgi:hypothetical protein